MNAQCVPVDTIALVCSPKVGNDWRHLKPLNKFIKISYPVKIWEQCNTMELQLKQGVLRIPICMVLVR